MLKKTRLDEKHLGIGAEMMRKFESYVLEHYGLHEIWLDVYADNKWLLGFMNIQLSPPNNYICSLRLRRILGCRVVHKHNYSEGSMRR